MTIICTTNEFFSNRITPVIQQTCDDLRAALEPLFNADDEEIEEMINEEDDEELGGNVEANDEPDEDIDWSDVWRSFSTPIPFPPPTPSNEGTSSNSSDD